MASREERASEARHRLKERVTRLELQVEKIQADFAYLLSRESNEAENRKVF